MGGGLNKVRLYTVHALFQWKINWPFVALWENALNSTHASNCPWLAQVVQDVTLCIQQ